MADIYKDDINPLSIRSSLTDSFRLYFNHFLPYFGLILLFSIPSMLYEIYQYNTSPSLPSYLNPPLPNLYDIFFSAITQALGYFAFAIIAINVFKDMAGKTPQFSASISAVFSNIIPLMLTCLVAYGAPAFLIFIAQHMGSAGIIFTVFALMLSFRWYIALEVCIIEGLPP